ncbi:MAG TPA: sulfur globule protein precursor [Microvirga sp.]|jgi:hypothetical protein|nr:sulfur globule protein precursor [Microvirga sp.]
MSRLNLRTAMTALALGIAALGGATLSSGEAAAKGFHGGGWGKHHGHGWHGGWGRRHWGPTFVSYGAYPVVYGGCYTKRFVRFDGSLIIKKRCY